MTKIVKPLLLLSLFLTSLFTGSAIKAQGHALSVPKLTSIKLVNTSGKSQQINLNNAIIIVFLSPECPLCKNYLPGLVNLQKANKNISFYGVVPGKSYSLKEIGQLAEEYKINFPLLNDRDKILSKFLKATTTPQVFLVNKLGGITYSGLIDNWAVSLGQQRVVVTEKYLEQAIKDLVNNKNTFKETQPVGCLINDI